MTESFPMEVDETFWEEVVDRLVEETDHDRQEIERGLTFMLGRRARQLLEAARDGDEAVLEELEIAITHSLDEK
jgi:hypothetical protein